MPSRACTTTARCGNHRPDSPVRKDFVVIGNGPSGIALSYLLAGHRPYYTGGSTDEFLHARLSLQPGLSLVEQDLELLSDGLEGRSNNPVSLLLDALQRPEADLGLELPSLLEWRRAGPAGRTGHVVLGRGRPGGIWQSLDPEMLTVSLAGWMELPNLTMADWQRAALTKEPTDTAASPPAATKPHHSKNRRISAGTLASYYPDYVDMMGLADHFEDNTVVTSVRQLEAAAGGPEPEQLECIPAGVHPQLECIPAGVHPQLECIPERESVLMVPGGGGEEVFSFDTEEGGGGSDMSSLCSSLTGLAHRGSFSSISADSSLPPPSLPSPYDRLRPQDSGYSCSLQCGDYDDCDFLCNWNPILNPSLFGSQAKCSVPTGASLTAYSASLGESLRRRCRRDSLSTAGPPAAASRPVFEVSGYRVEGDRHLPFTYLANNVVLATGQADTPNRLEVPGEELPFVLHSLPELEAVVGAGRLTAASAPVLVVGAGLSAADAIISAQGHNVPVSHVFRKSVADPQLIFNKLPVNLYPEYHAVHGMMKGGEVEGGYRAWAETEVVRIHPDRRVDIRGPGHTLVTLQVSHVVVLIGACPNLSFLSTEGGDLGRVPGQPIGRNNPIDVEAFSHQSVRVPGLFALGPLTGDNFVRFLQGGAVAIASHVQHARTGR